MACDGEPTPWMYAGPVEKLDRPGEPALPFDIAGTFRPAGIGRKSR